MNFKDRIILGTRLSEVISPAKNKAIAIFYDDIKIPEDIIPLYKYTYDKKPILLFEYMCALVLYYVNNNYEFVIDTFDSFDRTQMSLWLPLVFSHLLKDNENLFEIASNSKNMNSDETNKIAYYDLMTDRIINKFAYSRTYYFDILSDTLLKDNNKLIYKVIDVVLSKMYITIKENMSNNSNFIKEFDFENIIKYTEDNKDIDLACYILESYITSLEEVHKNIFEKEDLNRLFKVATMEIDELSEAYELRATKLIKRISDTYISNREALNNILANNIISNNNVALAIEYISIMNKDSENEPFKLIKKHLNNNILI